MRNNIDMSSIRSWDDNPRKMSGVVALVLLLGGDDVNEARIQRPTVIAHRHNTSTCERP